MRLRALPSGALNQLTMDTTGRLCQSGIGSNVCSQATAYLARTTGGNEGGNAVNITALICGLVSDGVITGDMVATGCGKFDGFYVLAQQNEADALLNLCGTNYSMTHGAAIFVAYQGFHGFTTGLDTQFNPQMATTPNYALNSASFGAWVYAELNDGNAIIGQSVGQTDILDNYGGAFYSRINRDGGSTTAPAAAGLYVGDRISSSSVSLYYNGVGLSTVSASALAVLSVDFTVGAVGTYITTETLSEAHIGASLGPTLELALYNRLRTYMTAVGVP